MATTAPDPAPVDRDAVLIVGNLTGAELLAVREAVRAALAKAAAGTVQSLSLPPPSTSSPSKATAFLPGHDPTRPAMLTMAAASIDALCRQLHQAQKWEAKLAKAMSAIHEYQKQQQRVISDFSILSQKYQQAKATLQSVLWQRLPRLPEYGSIPELDEALEESETQAGPYSLGKLLGTGHFANVKEIQEQPHQQQEEDEGMPVAKACKAIDKQHVKNLQALLRVAHEIEALRQLRHPSIIRLYDVLHGPRFVYVVTEKMSTDLYDIIGEHPEGTNGELAQRIITPILSALLFIHANGFLHRDLKPENILVNSAADAEELTVKLCDFGLCCRMPAPGTMLTDFCGSPGFICPEMVVERRYDGRSADFFSVGCVLLELLLPAGDFAKVWMQTFDDELMTDALNFKVRLRGAVKEAEAILRGKLAGTHDELLALMTGLLQVDAFQRHSTAEVTAFLEAVHAPGYDSGAAPAAAPDAHEAEAPSAELEGLALDDQPADDNMAAAAARNESKRASRRSPVIMAGGRARAISPIPSPSRAMAVTAAAPVPPRNNDSHGASSTEASKPKRMVDAVAARPAGLVIASPKGIGTSGSGVSGVRSTLRAQVLQRERDKDVMLVRPDCPGTPLAGSPAPSEINLDGLNSPVVGTPLGSPTAAGRIVEG